MALKTEDNIISPAAVAERAEKIDLDDAGHLMDEIHRQFVHMKKDTAVAFLEFINTTQEKIHVKSEDLKDNKYLVSVTGRKDNGEDVQITSGKFNYTKWKEMLVAMFCIALPYMDDVKATKFLMSHGFEYHGLKK